MWRNYALSLKGIENVYLLVEDSDIVIVSIVLTCLILKKELNLVIWLRDIIILTGIFKELIFLNFFNYFSLFLHLNPLIILFVVILYPMI